MSSLTQSLDNLVHRIETRGIAASIDPRDLNPPCAWVSLDAVRTTFGGVSDVDAVVMLIVPDNGAPTAIDTLGDMFDTIADIPGVGEARADTVTLPQSGAPLPALRLTLPIGA